MKRPRVTLALGEAWQLKTRREEQPFEQPCHHLGLSYSDQQLLLNVRLGEVQTWKG